MTRTTKEQSTKELEYKQRGKNLLTYMLGYIEPKQWADALRTFKGAEAETEVIYALMKEQEETYAFSLIDEVEALGGKNAEE